MPRKRIEANPEVIKKIKKLINEHNEFVVFDIETTGFSAKNGDKIIEIGAIRLKDDKIIDTFSQLINPEEKLDNKIIELTGVTDEMLQDKPTYKEVLPKFKNFVKDTVVVAHNANFDCNFIKWYMRKIGLTFDNNVIDTLEMARDILTDMKSHKLNLVCDKLGIKQENHHRAVDDSKVTAKIFAMLKKHYIDNKKEIKTNLKIRKISYWARGNYERIYVNAKEGTAFFDIKEKKWNIKYGNINKEELHYAVCNILKVNNINELCNFRGKYFAS